jgi:hypothetical protein
MRHLLRYIADLWKGWVGIMSSTASVIFLALGLFRKITERGQLRYWLGAAFTCYAVASFWTWFRIRPDLAIDIQQTSLDRGITQPELREKLELSQTVEGEPSYVTLTLHIVNTKQQDNSLKSYQLVVFLKSRLQWWSGVHAEPVTIVGFMPRGANGAFVDLNSFSSTVLKQGWPSPPGCIRFRVPRSKKQIVGKKFTLGVRDVYNVTHKVRGSIPSDCTDDIVYDPNP